MQVTNGERGDLIDALALAIEFCQSLIDSNLPIERPSPPQDRGRVKFFRPLTKRDAADYAEWSGQIKRFRRLRRRLLAEEKAA